jgi:preprotein translocase subunit SecE
MAETTVVTGSANASNGLKQKSFTFFSDVAREMRKVSWPKREELQDASVITLVLCVILAIFTFAADKVFEKGITGLFNLF